MRPDLQKPCVSASLASQLLPATPPQPTQATVTIEVPPGSTVTVVVTAGPAATAAG
jgi:hypothetical protein